jgi:hypothetical protein
MEDPRQRASQDALNRIEQWHSAGSELAKLVSIRRHLMAGLDARGLGLADTVSSRGWQVLGTRMEMAGNEIQELLSNKKISLSLLDSFIDSARYRGISMDNCEKVLKQSIERYPQATDCIVSTCISLLPRWGGKVGEGGALVAAIAEQYPAAEGKMLYARVALGLVSGFGDRILEPTESGFDTYRVLSNSEIMLERGIMTIDESETLMRMARTVGKLEYIDRLAKYHYLNFGMIGGRSKIVGATGFSTDVLLKLSETREKAFPADYDPSK